MKILINHTTSYLARSIDQLTEVSNMLQETIHSPDFKGDTASVQERFQELKIVREDLEWYINYLKTMNLDI
jgi:hypothetical protein